MEKTLGLYEKGARGASRTSLVLDKDTLEAIIPDLKRLAESLGVAYRANF